MSLISKPEAAKQGGVSAISEPAAEEVCPVPFDNLYGLLNGAAA